MQTVLGVVRNDFDVVMVDMPPLLERADALALNPIVSEVVLVIEAGRTGLSDLNLFTERTKAAGLHIVTAVLNREKPLLPGWMGG
jgi:Mrp family chromosome partitioning ATPase